jgi:hypothetical protein
VRVFLFSFSLFLWFSYVTFLAPLRHDTEALLLCLLFPLEPAVFSMLPDLLDDDNENGKRDGTKKSPCVLQLKGPVRYQGIAERRGGGHAKRGKARYA